MLKQPNTQTCRQSNLLRESDLVPLTTPQGDLLGEKILLNRRENEVAGNVINVFKGIPYAAPPVGNLRWKPALPAGQWQGERLATQFAPSPMQPNNPDRSAFLYQPAVQTSEDCLYLNVWSPAEINDGVVEDNDSPYPVMVWLYGGGLIVGSSALPVYDGAELAAKGAVIVTINYRVGVFGYFSHPALSEESPHGASGNYGVSDQVEALRWVKNTISAYGGDPDNVTIFGESAGALSVSHLMASPLANGLFHKAIMQSAYLPPMPELSKPGYNMLSAEDYGCRFARECGVTHDDKKGLDRLRSISAEQLLSHALDYEFDKAVVDGWVFSAQIFEIFEQREQQDVPLLAGFNADECNYFSLYGSVKAPACETEYTEAIHARYGDLSESYLNCYPATDIHKAVYAAISEGLYGWGTQKLTSCMDSKQSKSYFYYFNHTNPWADALGVGAFHTSDLPYSFNNIKYGVNFCLKCPDMSGDKRELHLADMISNYWISFARTGEPVVEGQPNWPAYGDKSRPYMRIANGQAKAETALKPDVFALHENIVSDRRARNIDWTYKNIGLLAAPLNPDIEDAHCE